MQTESVDVDVEEEEEQLVFFAHIHKAYLPCIVACNKRLPASSRAQFHNIAYVHQNMFSIRTQWLCVAVC